MASSRLRFALTGSGQQLVACAELLLARGHHVVSVLSDSADVSAWARRRGVARITLEQAHGDWITRTPFDYLVSVVNHAILTPELLAAPSKCAVNYHDSLLPEYAGFNATAWAILDGKTSHGVTWHVMTTDVDGGGILAQREIDISDDDTAFTLTVKCGEAGVSEFATLVDRMERDALGPTPQQGHRSFHLRSDRPGPAVLDFSLPAGRLFASVRGLNFGPEDNWMSKPKLSLPGGFLAVTEARLDATRTGAAGTVLAITREGIHVAAQSGALWLSELSTLDGAALDGVEAAARFGLVEGQRLAPLEPAFATAAHEFDATVTKSERFWVQRLASLRAPALAGLEPHQGAKRPRVLSRALPGALRNAPSDRRNTVLVAALAAYVVRQGATDGDTFDLASRAGVPDSLRALYATDTPLRCTVAPTTTFGALIEQTGAELALQAKRRTYARDAALRYRALRERTPVGLPIGVWCADAVVDNNTLAASALSAGVHLALVSTTGSEYAWVCDEAAISADAARALADRFDVLLNAAVESEQTPVSALPLLPPAERDLLLTTWQQTTRAYDGQTCVHEQFERQVSRTPDKTAVVFGETALTYRDLNRRANALAHALRTRGVGPDVLVAICVERSLDMIVGLLGILKAGGAYVPMDPAYPRERLSMMIDDSRARIVVTQKHLVPRLPTSDAEIVLVDELRDAANDPGTPASGVNARHLAYVIFTSGSTGRPKGTMVEHRNVANFFAGMDVAVGAESPGVWLAVTSISFDISVLELFWTLARGFEVVIAPESDRASLERRSESTAGSTSKKPMGFGLFYFAADSGSVAGGNAYRLLIEGAKFADEHGFEAVWTPERHFHAFGGLYPNPAVTTAALATITKRVALRAGSVVLPLHNPLRVAEDWSVIDQLSGGRVGLSFASGWHVNDFAFMPENFERRREIMLEHIDTVMKLWRGEKVSVRNGNGEPIEVSVLPRPVQARPPIWIASAGSVDTFILAGRLGANVLTNMLGQDLADLKKKFAAYRAARREHGHEGDGTISVMLHTFVCGSDEEARRLARKPFSDYLTTSFDLVKVAPKMFPAFRQPSRGDGHDAAIDHASFTSEDMAALMEHAFDRYFETAGLFGTPERALDMVNQLAEIGATEIACLIDFGIDPSLVLESLPHLHRLQELCRSRHGSAQAAPQVSADGIADLIRRHHVTHVQCTPSMGRVLANDPDSLAALAQLDVLLLGGEALPTDLAEQLARAVRGKTLNMYGPTETTVWSTTSTVQRAGTPTIGRPIANTVVRILDAHGQLVPVGTPGELHIGGAGVARGYLSRPELTSERFVADSFAAGERLYRTGDLARYRADGEIEFLGRLDHQAKINGHRVELGEIETVLTRHHAVRQSVVMARQSGTGSPALVAYVVLAGDQSSLHSDAERVSDWQSIWDATYKRSGSADGAADPRFRIAGWNDSYTGEPIPAPQMREWLDATVERIRALGPKRVLEIGCGTGMILYRTLPHVAHYTGVDISHEALESIRRELTDAEAAKVSLLLQPAHALEGVADRSCDTVVINSVAQYFPDADYLMRVVRRATDLVADGGRIFIGDVRSLAHLDAFHTAVELAHAPPGTNPADLRAGVTRRIANESELVLSEAFFHALVRETPRLCAVDVELKRGHARNELTAFRYDVVLHVGPKSSAARAAVAIAPTHADSLDAIRAQLAREPVCLQLTDVPNARLQDRGVDPEALYSLSEAYDVHVRWAHSGDPATLDAILQRKTSGGANVWPFEAPPHEQPPAAYANTPLRVNNEGTLATQWRAHLASSLPAYMIPATFVLMDAFPLTPNGKIDRKALPEPKGSVGQAAVRYVAPSSDLEQQIAEVWRELLAVERVGRQENIFDLGANSLLTMQANNRLAALLGRKVSLVSMFRYPTVESLAAHLGENGSPAAPANEKRAQDRATRAEQAAARRRALRAGKKDR